MPPIVSHNTKPLAKSVQLWGASIICGLCIWDVLERALIAASRYHGLLQNHQALLEESDVRSNSAIASSFLCGLRDFGSAAAVKKLLNNLDQNRAFR